MAAHIARQVFLGVALGALVGCGGLNAPAGSDLPASASTTASPLTNPVSPPVPSAAPALTVSWARPDDDATIRTSKLEMAATATRGVPAQVVFSAEASGGSIAGCKATAPARDGTWSCTIDLLATGIPPGALTLAFVIRDGAGGLVPAAGADRAITYAVAPPKPVTTFTSKTGSVRADGTYLETDTVTWTEPAGYATEFRLYGVADCLADAAKNDGQPCLPEHMALPSKSLMLIKKVGGDVRSIKLEDVISGELCGGGLMCGKYSALVLSAYNAYGHSVFAIPYSDVVCFSCTY